MVENNPGYNISCLKHENNEIFQFANTAKSAGKYIT